MSDPNYIPVLVVGLFGITIFLALYHLTKPSYKHTDNDLKTKRRILFDLEHDPEWHFLVTQYGGYQPKAGSSKPSSPPASLSLMPTPTHTSTSDLSTCGTSGSDSGSSCSGGEL